jgi:hypothetical protein
MYFLPSVVAGLLLATIVVGLGCSWIVLAYLIAQDENERRDRKN